MNNKMKILLFFIALIGVVFADLARFAKCDSDDICEVTEVRINPCKDGRFCRLTKGEESSIEFDFIPKFNASNLTTGLYWAALKRDVPFVDFPEVNACLLTSCPTVAGSKQQLSYTTRLSETLPTGRWTFKWKLWSSEDKKKVCCFKTEVSLALKTTNTVI
ncbi:MD-2-related lipid-recognition protein-like isoform X2 [Pararge aegeria]|uniref:MD-2-related lipid-recognition protein-like isoform X2 n=1 Tax=Pararge aegeria TaxID=116150 RepID=UPI0019D20377|nr:MD-2-related lipid-recognition protein-like isoform X2 [Pararge aegeria]